MLQPFSMLFFLFKNYVTIILQIEVIYSNCKNNIILICFPACFKHFFERQKRGRFAATVGGGTYCGRPFFISKGLSGVKLQTICFDVWSMKEIFQSWKLGTRGHFVGQFVNGNVWNFVNWLAFRCFLKNVFNTDSRRSTSWSCVFFCISLYKSQGSGISLRPFKSWQFLFIKRRYKCSFANK